MKEETTKTGEGEVIEIGREIGLRIGVLTTEIPARKRIDFEVADTYMKD